MATASFVYARLINTNFLVHKDESYTQILYFEHVDARSFIPVQTSTAWYNFNFIVLHVHCVTL